MRLENSNIKFPVMGITAKAIWYFHSYADLTDTTAVGLKKGQYESMEIIDSTGNSFAVTEAKFQSGIGIFGGFNLLGGRKIRVTLGVVVSPNITALADLKHVIKSKLRFGPVHNSTGMIRELSKRFEECQDFPSLIRSFGNYWWGIRMIEQP